MRERIVFPFIVLRHIMNVKDLRHLNLYPEARLWPSRRPTEDTFSDKHTVEQLALDIVRLTAWGEPLWDVNSNQLFRHDKKRLVFTSCITFGKPSTYVSRKEKSIIAKLQSWFPDGILRKETIYEDESSE